MLLRSLARASEACRSRAGLGTERRPSRDGRGSEAREQRRLLGELVTAIAVDATVSLQVDAVAARQAHDAAAHHREHAPDVVIRRRRQRNEACVVAGEHTLNDARAPSPFRSANSSQASAWQYQRRGRNFGSVTSALTSSNVASTGSPMRSSSREQSTMFDSMCGPSSRATITTAYGTSAAKPGW